MRHTVTLSNGKTVILTEGRQRLSVALEDDAGTAYLCLITPDGVLVYPNSHDAPEDLVRGLIGD